MIFGFCSLATDFNGANQGLMDSKRLGQLQGEIARRWPEALPNFSLAEPIYRTGHIIAPSPVAIEVGTTSAMKEAMETAGEKLAHALYYREMKRIMQSTDRFFTARTQTQKLGAETLTAFFKQLLPDITMGSRPNIKDYGHRFMYMSGCKPVEGSSCLQHSLDSECCVGGWS